MDDKAYNIIDSKKTDLEVVIQDYHNATNPLLKSIRIGVIGTVLLCATPAIYAKEHSYKILNNNETTLVEEDYNCGLQIEALIETVNNFKSVNYTKKEIFKSILSFKSLVQNWDGYNAVPLEVESASNALYLVNSLDEDLIGQIDDYFPNSHGTISFEWLNEYGEKVYLEIGNESFSYFAKFNSSEPLFFDNQEFSNENIEVLAKNIKAI